MLPYQLKKVEIRKYFEIKKGFNDPGSDVSILI